MEIDFDDTVIVEVEADDVVTIVPDGDPDLVDVLGDDHILGHVDHPDRDDDFPFHGVLDGHHHPEGAADEEKEQKNQKLLALEPEKEVPEFIWKWI